MNPDFNHKWIISDIGGTHARFNRWSTQSGLSDNPPARYRNDDFPDIAALINQYRGDAAPHVVHAMLALALALPIGPGEMRMTNRSWAFTAQGLRADAGLAQLRLVNDFVAAAAGIGALSASESIQIGGLRSSVGPVVVLGPGTGLGTAVIMNDGPEPQVMPSEAGHMGAAPSGDDARTVLERSAFRGDGAALLRALAQSLNGRSQLRAAA